MNRNLFVGLLVIIFVIGGIIYFQGNSNDQSVDSPIVNNTSELSEDLDSQEDSEDSDTEVGATVITLSKDGFSPKTLTVKIGEEVVWLNNSGGKATVDSSVHPTHRDYPKLNLGTFSDGDKHSFVFDESGTYRYHDHLNASRFGTVVVEE